MRRTSRRENRSRGDGSPGSLDSIVPSVLLLAIIAVVLLHPLSKNDNADPTPAPSLEFQAAVTVPTPEENLSTPSTPADPVTKSPKTIRRGGDNQLIQPPIIPRRAPAELATYKPNELGHIPVLTYHAFTTNPEYLDDWTTTPDWFRDDLQWLYDHDFFIISMADLIDDEISAPLGKHPVVLTFDDSSSGQFRLLADDAGELSPDPSTAVGVMEAFFAGHPDFGRGGFFAVVPVKCFSRDDEVTTCEERLTWLAERGYEIGNHTWWHENLGDVSDDNLMSQIGDTKLWIDERVSGDANRSTILVLPFGEYPGYEWQFDMLVSGFAWREHTVRLTGVVTANGGPSVSPSSAAWDPWAIARLNTDDLALGYWKEQISSGAMTMYTSDGNPASIAIPKELPEDLVDQFDADVIASRGRSLILYDAAPADEPTGFRTQRDVLASVRRGRFARQKQPSRA